MEPDDLIHLIEPKISADMNEDLCRAFSPEEISDALFQMGPLKAPGPDGFPARFFQRYWEVVKDDVVAAVQGFFRDGYLPLESMTQLLCLFLKGQTQWNSKTSGRLVCAM